MNNLTSDHRKKNKSRRFKGWGKNKNITPCQIFGFSFFFSLFFFSFSFFLLFSWFNMVFLVFSFLFQKRIRYTVQHCQKERKERRWREIFAKARHSKDLRNKWISWSVFRLFFFHLICSSLIYEEKSASLFLLSFLSLSFFFFNSFSGYSQRLLSSHLAWPAVAAGAWPPFFSLPASPFSSFLPKGSKASCKNPAQR